MPTIPTLPPYPSRCSAPDTFSLQADAFVAAMPNWGVQVQAVGDQAAADAATATAAMSSAVAAANYKGIYSAGTTYQIGESVAYSGARYYAKTVNTGVTPVDGANWSLINEIPSVSGNTGRVLKAGASAPTWQDSANVQEFTSSGTWTKPAGCSVVMVELLGAGGGGGSGHLGATSNGRYGGGGGGGGALAVAFFRASELGATETVTIASGGTGGAGRTGTTANGNDGGDAGASTFGAVMTAYGGRGGSGGQSSSTVVGRGHGGSTVPALSTGMPPYVQQTGVDLQHGFGGIGGCSATQIGRNPGRAEFGGAAGAPAGGANTYTMHQGGSSRRGGGGGGAGGGVTSSNTADTNSVSGAGGSSGNISPGGGGGPGTTTTTGTAGTAGSAPTGTNLAGTAGGGGGGGTTGSGGAGGAGGRGCGGGGGGAGTGTANTSGAGGNGGAGYCRVTAW